MLQKRICPSFPQKPIAPMEISVVIPTYNGENKIPKLLEALAHQSHKNFEVVVVIDGSTDNTERILENAKNRFAKFKVIKQHNSGRAKVRNRGVLEASGDLLIFLDDDMVPNVDCVGRHFNFHKQNPIQSILAGNQTEERDHNYTDIQNYKAFLSKKWLSPYANGITELTLKNLFVSAANCSIKRADFEALSGFDERLTDAEDYDLAFRGLKMGMHIFFDKDNIAIHNDNPSAISYLKRLRAYHCAHIQLSEIHYTPTLSSAKPFYKVVIYRLFASKLWIKLFDRDILKYLMPTILRFKLYDLVFQSLSIEYSNYDLD